MKTDNGKIENLNNLLESAKYSQRELDKAFFHLRSLSDVSQELYGLENIEKISETFLLMTMGAFGVSHGFVLVIDTEALDGKVSSRGIENNDLKNLMENISGITKKYFPIASGDDPPEMTGGLFSVKEPDGYPFCPSQTELLIQWTINRNISGLLGIGKKITADEFTREEKEFLLGFTNILMIHISRANSMGIIRELSLDVGDRNIEFKKALKHAENTQKKLDRRVYHLKTLYDVMLELSGLTATKKIMETFLLMIMGAFSVIHGYVLLIDKKERTAHMACRGIGKDKLNELQIDEFEKIIGKYLKAGQNKDQASMYAQIVTEKKILDNEAVSIDAGIGLLFVIDEKTIGLIGLGNKITEEDYSEDERELLSTLTNNFMLFLKNAISFEVIQKLNIDLEKRNIDLEKTVEELTASRNKIELLERAKARVKSVIQNEIERAGRLSTVDIFLIIFAGLVLGLIFNFSSPEGITLLPHSWSHKTYPVIDVDSTKMKHDAGTAIFVDARPADFYKQKHIKGAVNLPLALFDFVYMMKFSSIGPKKELIVYGRNISRRYDQEVAFKLASRGHVNVKVLSGGLPVWQKRRYPLEQ
jgi:rhodanese-related sulfurtransferase/GAF domain-containing protein